MSNRYESKIGGRIVVGNFFSCDLEKQHYRQKKSNSQRGFHPVDEQSKSNQNSSPYIQIILIICFCRTGKSTKYADEKQIYISIRIFFYLHR